MLTDAPRKAALTWVVFLGISLAAGICAAVVASFGDYWLLIIGLMFASAVSGIKLIRRGGMMTWTTAAVILVFCLGNWWAVFAVFMAIQFALTDYAP